MAEDETFLANDFSGKDLRNFCLKSCNETFAESTNLAKFTALAKCSLINGTERHKTFGVPGKGRHATRRHISPRGSSCLPRKSAVGI